MLTSLSRAREALSFGLLACALLAAGGVAASPSTDDDRKEQAISWSVEDPDDTAALEGWGASAVPCQDNDEDNLPGDEEPVSGPKTKTVKCQQAVKGKIKNLQADEVEMTVGLSDGCPGTDSKIAYYDSSQGLDTPAKVCMVSDGTSGECKFTVKEGDMFRALCLGSGGGSCKVAWK